MDKLYHLYCCIEICPIGHQPTEQWAHQLTALNITTTITTTDDDDYNGVLMSQNTLQHILEHIISFE